MLSTDSEPCLGDFKPSSASLPIRNVDESILMRSLGRLSTCLGLLERSVSSDEKVTLMEEFTSTLSSCSNGSLAHEMSVYSMWTDSTQMLYAVTQHHKRVQLMQQKRGTLWQAGSTRMSSEFQYLVRALFGLSSSFAELETSFLKLAEGWRLEHSSAISPHSGVTPTGNIDPSPCHTQRLTVYRLRQQSFQNCLLGYHTLWRDLEIEVCEPPPLRVPLGNHGGVFRGPSAALSPFGTH